MLIPTTFWDSLPSVCWSAMPLSFQTSHQRASTSRSATHMTIQPRPLTAKETRSAMYSVPIHPGRWSVRERERRERGGGRERVRERERERDDFYVTAVWSVSSWSVVWKDQVGSTSSNQVRLITWQSCDSIYLYPLYLSWCTACPQQPISWCKCEAVVQSMSSISVVAEQPPPPPLVVMSLSVKIILNPKTGTNEVTKIIFLRDALNYHTAMDSEIQVPYTLVMSLAWGYINILTCT